MSRADEELMQPIGGTDPTFQALCAAAFGQERERVHEKAIRDQWALAKKKLGPCPLTTDYYHDTAQELEMWQFHCDAHQAVFLHDITNHRLRVENDMIAKMQRTQRLIDNPITTPLFAMIYLAIVYSIYFWAPICTFVIITFIFFNYLISEGHKIQIPSWMAPTRSPWHYVHPLMYTLIVTMIYVVIVYCIYNTTPIITCIIVTFILFGYIVPAAYLIQIPACITTRILLLILLLLIATFTFVIGYDNDK